MKITGRILEALKSAADRWRRKKRSKSGPNLCVKPVGLQRKAVQKQGNLRRTSVAGERLV